MNKTLYKDSNYKRQNIALCSGRLTCQSLRLHGLVQGWPDIGFFDTVNPSLIISRLNQKQRSTKTLPLNHCAMIQLSTQDLQNKRQTLKTVMKGRLIGTLERQS